MDMTHHTIILAVKQAVKVEWALYIEDIPNALQPIRSATQIWVVTHHQCRISALVSQTSVSKGTSSGVAKSRIFSHLWAVL